MWRRVVIYGGGLAAGTFCLQWLDYQRMARTHTGDIYIVLVAALFLALGVFIGMKALARPAPLPFDGNPQAQAALGISARELTVLQELAQGHSNKDIARRLNIAPDTVKTHVSRLYEKLGARRRTEAVNKARQLGIVP